MTKLKPCPFCGGGRVIEQKTRTGNTFALHCIDCGIWVQSWGCGKENDELFKMWNRRTVSFYADGVDTDDPYGVTTVLL